VLEIILLIVLCKKIGGIVAEKGHKRWPYQLMLVGFWIGGELGGAIVGAVISVATNGPREEPGFMPYVFALVGAAVGAILAFVIANSVRPVQTDEEFYGGEARPWGEYDQGPHRKETGYPGSTEFTDRPGQPPRPEPDDRFRT
jgi:hypothetical protein